MDSAKKQRVLEVLEFLKEKVKCPICLESIQSCAELHCSHRFCKECIDQHWEFSKSHDCPMCKRPYKRRQKISQNEYVNDVTNFINKASELLQKSNDDKNVEAAAFKATPSTSGNLNCSTNSKIYYKNVIDEPFDKLMNKPRRCYGSKARSKPKKPVLPFKETAAKETVLRWLSDANNKLDVFSQKAKQLEYLEQQKIQNSNALNLPGRERSQSLNLDGKKETPLLERYQSLTNDLDGFDDYSIEDIDSEKMIQHVEREVVQDILEDECLDNFDKVLQESVLNPPESAKKTLKYQKDKKLLPTSSVSSGWDRIKNVKHAIKKANKVRKRLNISVQSEGKPEALKKGKRKRALSENSSNQLANKKKVVANAENISLAAESIANTKTALEPETKHTAQENKTYSLTLVENYFLRSMDRVEVNVKDNPNLNGSKSLSKPISEAIAEINHRNTNIAGGLLNNTNGDADNIFLMPTQKSKSCSPLKNMDFSSTEPKRDEAFNSIFDFIKRVSDNEDSIDRIMEQLNDSLEKCVERTLEMEDPIPNSLIDCFLNLKSYVERVQKLRNDEKNRATQNVFHTSQAFQNKIFEDKTVQTTQKFDKNEIYSEDLVAQPLKLGKSNTSQPISIKFNRLNSANKIIQTTELSKESDSHNRTQDFVDEITELSGRKDSHTKTQDSVLFCTVPPSKNINRQSTFGCLDDSGQKRFEKVKKSADESLDPPETKEGHEKFIRDDLTIKFVDSQVNEIGTERSRRMNDYGRFLDDFLARCDSNSPPKEAACDLATKKGKHRRSQQTDSSTVDGHNYKKPKLDLESRGFEDYGISTKTAFQKKSRKIDKGDAEFNEMCNESITESDDIVENTPMDKLLSLKPMKKAKKTNGSSLNKLSCNRRIVSDAAGEDNIACKISEKNTPDQIKDMLDDIRNDPSFFNNNTESQVPSKGDILSEDSNVEMLNTESNDIVEGTPTEEKISSKSRIFFQNIKKLMESSKVRKFHGASPPNLKKGDNDEVQDMLEDIRNDPAFFKSNMESQISYDYQINAVQSVKNINTTFSDKNKSTCMNKSQISTKVPTFEDNDPFEDALIEAELEKISFTAEERKAAEPTSSNLQILQNIKVKSQDRQPADAKNVHDTDDDEDVVYGTPENVPTANDRRTEAEPAILPFREIANLNSQPFDEICLPPPPGFDDDFENSSPKNLNITPSTQVGLTELIVTPETCNLSRKFAQYDENVKDKSFVISGRNGGNNSNHSTPRSQFKEMESLGFSPIKESTVKPRTQEINPIVPKFTNNKTNLLTSTPNQRSILNYLKTSQDGLVARSHTRKPCVTWSRVIDKDMNCFTQLEIKKLITVSHNWNSEVTHLVVLVDDRGRLKSYTAKYLLAVAHGAWVVRYEWVQDSAKYGKIVSEEPYEVLDLSGTSGPKISRLSQGRQPLFKNYRFFCSPPFQLISRDGIETVVQKLGAEVVNKVEKLEREDDKIGIIITDSTATEIMDEFEEYLTKFRVVTVHVEWLAKCIGQYKINSVRPYLVCSDENVHELGYPTELVESVPFTLTEATNLGD